MGSKTSEPKLGQDVFATRDGLELPFTVWGPRKNPSKVVIAAHSFGEFRDAYALIGEHFASQSIAVWAYDQRGFGDAPHRGFWSSKETMVQDFQDFAELIRDQVGADKPLVMLGESMGAAVVLASLADTSTPRPDAIILSGPGVREKRPRRYWYNAGLWVLTHLVPGFEVDAERTFDPRLADVHAKRWAEDPRVIDRVRLDTYFGLIRLSDLASNTASAVDVPTLVLFGSDDTQIHPKSLCALMDRLGNHGTLKLFKDKPHLVFQIKEQDTVLPLIDHWLENSGETVHSDHSKFCAT